ncbi:Uncharacterized protein TPAR_04185 [Tolypocladium paradoxum]|uniref:Uncharacterized protein n=1 Tax=Tolypocladium paradoxum TaxID=94208 RepID=A0A2S4KZM9_9HYPO|nr:Uncharacterized protein TPAR_04185 [Tolypocladium paradoxum]
MPGRFHGQQRQCNLHKKPSSPDDKTLSSETSSCTIREKPSCPTRTTLVGQVGALSCPPSFKLDNNRCVHHESPTCPDGSHRDGDACVTSEIRNVRGVQSFMATTVFPLVAPPVRKVHRCSLASVSLMASRFVKGSLRGTGRRACPMASLAASEHGVRDVDDCVTGNKPICDDASAFDGVRCVSKEVTPACPEGSVLSRDGDCLTRFTPSCPPAANFRNGVCVVGSAKRSQGYVVGDAGCESTDGPQCPDNFMLVNGACVAVDGEQCPRGYIPNGRPVHFKKRAPVRPKFAFNGTACVSDSPICPPGTFLDGHNCMSHVDPQCQRGFTFNGNRCVAVNGPLCPPGAKYDVASQDCISEIHFVAPTARFWMAAVVHWPGVVVSKGIRCGLPAMACNETSDGRGHHTPTGDAPDRSRDWGSRGSDQKGDSPDTSRNWDTRPGASNPMRAFAPDVPPDAPAGTASLRLHRKPRQLQLCTEYFARSPRLARFPDFPGRAESVDNAPDRSGSWGPRGSDQRLEMPAPQGSDTKDNASGPSRDWHTRGSAPKEGVTVRSRDWNARGSDPTKEASDPVGIASGRSGNWAARETDKEPAKIPGAGKKTPGGPEGAGGSRDWSPRT